MWPNNTQINLYNSLKSGLAYKAFVRQIKYRSYSDL
jgi:hypothetical protein